MDQVTRAAAAYRRDVERAERSRAALHAAILDAIRDGRSQADLSRATGYTREWLRKLAKGNGRPPA